MKLGIEKWKIWWYNSPRKTKKEGYFMANTKQISGHKLNPDGRMQPAYNRPKRFFRTLFRKVLLPSLITAGIVVGAFALIPALSTAVSLTFANAALIGAGTFAATSTLIGGGTLIHEKASARRRVKRALKKNIQLEAMNFIQPETVLNNGNPVYANGLNPPRHGKGFWRRRNMLYQYLKQNRNCDPESPTSNQALVQRIIDGNETNKFIDLVVLAAKRGYLGDKSRDAVKNRENKQKLKNLRYLSESDADQLMEDVFGIENHFKTLGGSQGSPVVTSSRKSKKSVQKDYGYVDEATIDAIRQQLTGARQSQDMTPEQLAAIASLAQARKARSAQPTAPAEPNSYTSVPEEKGSLVRAVISNPTHTPASKPAVEEDHVVIDDKSLIKSIVEGTPEPAPVVKKAAATADDVIAKKKSLEEELRKTQAETPKPAPEKRPLVTLSGIKLR